MSVNHEWGVDFDKDLAELKAAEDRHRKKHGIKPDREPAAIQDVLREALQRLGIDIHAAWNNSA